MIPSPASARKSDPIEDLGPGTITSLFLLSAATLAFEINLTRLFSVAQFYHFAFMIVSVALLGFGASGTALTIFPVLQRGQPRLRLGQFSLAAAASILAAYLLTNWLPFDSFSIAWDRRQVFILILHYLALAAPFFFSGMALGFLLSAFSESAGPVYAVNLIGSAAGCVVAVVAPTYLGGEGMVTLSTALAALAALAANGRRQGIKSPRLIGAAVLLIFTLIDIGLRLFGSYGFTFLELRISQYKSLSYALQYPGAQVVYKEWNASSRIDVVRSRGIHSVPGLSYRYMEPLPDIDGLLVDGDDLSPLISPPADLAFVSYLPDAVAFQLRPQASTLVLEPRGGTSVLTALSLSKGPVTSAEINPLIVEAAPVYSDSRMRIHIESSRSFLQRSQEKYDVILLSLGSSFHPVQSGAYALGEEYRYTVESFLDMLAHLNPGGLLFATRWLQDPPSEDLRLFALAVTALEASGANPRLQLVAFRGFNTASILLKNGAFTPAELAMIREFAAQRAFDLSYAPGILPEETNQYNILPTPKYYEAYTGLVEAQSRQAFYEEYAYDVRPPTDDQPFFGHYFKWAQAPEVLAGMGKAWLPFGGAGYFVILALLLLASILAGALIMLPVLFQKRSNLNTPGMASPFILRNLFYFGMLGFAFLLVEIPLLQRFILYLGRPAYAVTAVLFSLLLFSGMGSRWSDRIPVLLALGALVILVLVMPALLPLLFDMILGWSLAARLGVTIVTLAPAGFLMGVPFPAGLRLLTRGQTKSEGKETHSEDTPRTDISWIWAVNGAASVIAPILAALLALTFGFNKVIQLGALCYAAAWLTAWLPVRRGSVQRPAR